MPVVPGTSTFATTGTNFSLNFTNSSLAPLSKYQSKLAIFRGLNYQDALLNNTSGHQSPTTVLTGAKCNYNAPNSVTGTSTSGTSIDQYLYSRMAVPNSPQPLIVGVQPYLDNQYGSINYIKGVQLQPNGDPASVFKTYFGNLGTGVRSPASQQQLTRRQSVMSFAQSGLTGLMNQLATSEQQKLQQHMSALVGLENQLSSSTSSSASCTPPASASIAADTGSANGTNNWSQTPQDLTNFMTLITQSFACDITRFATMTLYSNNVQAPAAVNIMAKESALTGFNYPDSSGGFHAYTHGTSGVASNSADIDMAQYQNYWATQVAALMDMLAAVSDPLSPGQTLLDNTVILFMKEHGIVCPSPNPHNYADVPIVLAGGCGGMFKLGQLIEATPRLGSVLNQNGSLTMYKGIAHNALLTQIVNAFETNQHALNTSFVPNILAQYGDYAGSSIAGL